MRNKCDELSELEASNNCKECPFFNYCFSHLPKNNIFKLAGSVILYGIVSVYIFGLIRLFIMGG